METTNKILSLEDYQNIYPNGSTFIYTSDITGEEVEGIVDRILPINNIKLGNHIDADTEYRIISNHSVYEIDRCRPKMRTITMAEILEVTKLHPLKVKNVYLFGSRVYGSAGIDSDYDLIVVANSMQEAAEIRSGDLNIHIHTPDKFRKDLFDFDMHNLECLFAPDFARIQMKVPVVDANFKIKPEQLKFKAMSQSYNSFHKAKLKFLDEDFYTGGKSLYHSLRILMFAIQILGINRRIYNFGEANDIWKKVQNDILCMENSESEYLRPWEYMKNEWLPIKIELENKLKNL